MRLKKRSTFAALFIVLLTLAPSLVRGADDPSVDDDLELLQGSWELRHGNEGNGPPTIRSVKTIAGNRETLCRYSIESGEKLSEKVVEFELHDADPVRVFTFFPVGSKKKIGYSFVYKIEKNDFYDITGLLHGTEYRDYSTVPTMWRWKRIVEEPATESKTDGSAKPAKE